MISEILDFSWKNKKTGEPVFIGNICHRYKEDAKPVTCVRVLNWAGVQKEEIDELEFREKYEQVIPDFSNIIPNLLELALNDYQLREAVFKLARRLHSGGYFHVGDYVYIIGKEYLNEHMIETGENREIPYKIISIDVIAPLLQLVTIVPSNRWDSDSEDEDRYNHKKIKLPLYLDKFDSNDAFTCLRRYDMPY